MKVDVLIGGFQKCGTTALHSFLSLHHGVISSVPKELDYFNYNVNFEKGEAYYHSFFKQNFVNRFFRNYKYLESSPSYLSDGNITRTCQRIFEYNNNIKIIGLVRNPINRAFSAWQMYRQRFFSGDTDWWIKWMSTRSGLQPYVVRRTVEDYQSFYVFIKNELDAKMNGLDIECSVLKNGEYYNALFLFKKKFGDNFYIIKNESLDNNTALELDKVSEFIGLEKFNWETTKEQKIFKGNYSDKIDDYSKDILKDYYQEYNEKLFNLTSIEY